MKIDPGAIMVTALYNILTMYMLLILIRWLGPYLELDFHDTRLRWITRIVDPILRLVRSLVPRVGPIDLSPIVTVLILWLVRSVASDVVGAGLQ